MLAGVRWCWCSQPVASVLHSKAAPPSCWGEACGARGIRKYDGVAVVLAWQAAQRRWLVGVERVPCSGVAHGVVVAGWSLQVAYTRTPWRIISVAAGFMRT